MTDEARYLAETIQHIDITEIDVVPLVEAMRRMQQKQRLATMAEIIPLACDSVLRRLGS
jgi:hypothetical protein